ncbi:MAG: integrase core domain-containing protein [Thermoplasmata archaeon]
MERDWLPGEVYLNEYGDIWEAEENTREYFKFYNTVRPHSALNYRTPEKVYRMSKRENGKERTNLAEDERHTKLNFDNFLS